MLYFPALSLVDFRSLRTYRKTNKNPKVWGINIIKETFKVASFKDFALSYSGLPKTCQSLKTGLTPLFQVAFCSSSRQLMHQHAHMCVCVEAQGISHIHTLCAFSLSSLCVCVSHGRLRSFFCLNFCCFLFSKNCYNMYKRWQVT